MVRPFVKRQRKEWNSADAEAIVIAAASPEVTFRGAKGRKSSRLKAGDVRARERLVIQRTESVNRAAANASIGIWVCLQNRVGNYQNEFEALLEDRTSESAGGWSLRFARYSWKPNLLNNDFPIDA